MNIPIMGGIFAIAFALSPAWRTKLAYIAAFVVLGSMFTL